MKQYVSDERIYPVPRHDDGLIGMGEIETNSGSAILPMMSPPKNDLEQAAVLMGKPCTPTKN